MNRRNLLHIVIILAALGFAIAPSTRAADTKRPNILFILADDLGYGDLGCYGQKIIQTPNIDRLATEGMKFTSFYAGNAVCAPSRCTLITGLHSGHAFVRDNRELKPEGQIAIPADSVTVATVLKSAGYRTGCIGKWGLGGPGSTGEPNRQGFDYFYGYLCQRIAHSYYPDYLWRNTDKVMFPENAGGKRGAYSHDELTKEALAFIDKAKDSEPFFLYLPYTVPHFDLDVPDDSMAPYAGKWDEPALPMGSYRAQPKPRAAYAGMISRMDRDIGTLMELLKRKGMDENTLVIFTSDNGATFLKGLDSKFFNSAGGLHGYKADLYEGGIRVPMIARWPGRIKPGTTSDFAAAFYDVLPTLAEIANTPAPANLDGLSFAPTLLGKPQTPHEYLYWEFPEKLGQQAVRLGDWKGVRLNVKKAPEGPIELYDLKTEMAESKNVAAEHPEIVARMAQIMRSGRTESKEFPLRADQPPAATARANPLIGRWKILSMGKRKLPDNVQLFWTFDEHNVVVTVDNGDVATKSQYSIRNDRAHDVISLSEDGKKEPNRVGWYELKDGKLRIQVTLDTANPPEHWNEDEVMLFQPERAK